MNKLINPLLPIRQMSPRRLKTYTLTGLIGSLILLPDLYVAGAHYLIEFLHIFYEWLCYVLEELIGHTLHISKYYSQLILFYVQVTIVAGLGYKLWRAAPGFYRRGRAYLSESWRQMIQDGKQLWAEMPGRKRLKVLAGCAAGMCGLYFWVTS
ncbi:MAG: hypothetical protein ACU83V_03495 [Gammaproteobacteria bacterium]